MINAGELIVRHRVAVHRRLGIAGATLAGIIVVVGTFTALRFLRNNLHAPPAFGPPAPEFFGFLLFDLYVFGGLVASAILLRKNREAHRRLMLLATLSMISPGVVRIPFERLSPGPAFLGSAGPGGLFALDLLLLYACIAYDIWRTKKSRPAFIVGGALHCLRRFEPAWLARSYRCVAPLRGFARELSVAEADPRIR